MDDGGGRLLCGNAEPARDLWLRAFLCRLPEPAVSVADSLRRRIQPSPVGKVAERSEVG